MKILVIGDYCLDRYIHVYDSGRWNPENASAPLYIKSYEEEFDGMAYNVIDGLKKLGFNVWRTGANKSGTSVKTRIVQNNKMLCRIDEDAKFSQTDYIKSVSTVKFDAIVVSDYNKGSVTQDDIVLIQELFDCPNLFIDTKKTDLSYLDGWIIKINRDEYAKLQGLPNLENNSLWVTQGDVGIRRVSSFGDMQYYPTKQIIHPVDVCGAGDASLVGLVYGYLHDAPNAHKYALKAGEAAIQHLGVYMPTIEEIS